MVSGGVAATPIVTAVVPLLVVRPLALSFTVAWKVMLALAATKGAVKVALAV